MYSNFKQFITYFVLILIVSVIFFNVSNNSEATNNPAVLNPNRADTLILPANPGPSNNGGSPGWAMFFDLIASSSDINVTQMTTGNNATASTSFTVEVFTRSGTALGGPVGSGPGSSTAGWTSLGIVPVVQGPTSNGISLPFTLPTILVTANDTVGVALQFTGAGPRYVTGSGPYSVYSDTNLSLITGDVRSVPFTPTGSFFSPRLLTGEIRYVVNPPPPPTPQYYNWENVGTSNNTWPFGQPAGKASNWLFLPGAFANPTPLPSGQAITDVYFYVTTGGTRTYTNFQILMAQTTLTNLTTGQFYAGPWDTVYTSASLPLSWTSLSWSTPITLDTPFPYDTTKSLVVFVGQCSGPGTGMYIRLNNAPGGIKRVNSVGGCPFVPIGGGAATVNFGVNVTPFSGITPVSNIPDKFSLSQNYPNPFNPTTNIQFDLPKQGFVSLKVYDVVGKEVATLVNEVKNVGIYDVTFDGANLSSGIYFYRLEVNDFVAVKKMLLVK